MRGGRLIEASKRDAGGSVNLVNGRSTGYHSPMRSIAYFSTATAAMTEDDFAFLEQECAEHDSQVGITGMLLHKNGDFLQVIEGSNSVIRDMYARISADPRHTNIRKISDRTIPNREFDGDTMGFKNLDGLPSDTPFVNPFSYEAFEAEPELALLVLAFFFRNR